MEIEKLMLVITVPLSDVLLFQVAIMRCQANVMTDPQVILESLRSLIQPEINLR
jgi:hypothetical protein